MVYFVLVNCIAGELYLNNAPLKNESFFLPRCHMHLCVYVCPCVYLKKWLLKVDRSRQWLTFNGTITMIVRINHKGVYFYRHNMILKLISFLKYTLLTFKIEKEKLFFSHTSFSSLNSFTYFPSLSLEYGHYSH